MGDGNHRCVCSEKSLPKGTDGTTSVKGRGTDSGSVGNYEIGQTGSGSLVGLLAVPVGVAVGAGGGLVIASNGGLFWTMVPRLGKRLSRDVAECYDGKVALSRGE